MINIKDFLNYKSVNNLTLNINNSMLAFATTLPCLDTNSYKSDIYVMDLNGKEKKIFENTNINAFNWIDENEMLLKEKSENGTNFIKYNIKTQAKTQLFNLEYQVGKFSVLNNGQCLFTAIDTIDKEEYPSELSFLQKEDSEFEVIKEIPFWNNGKGYSSRKRNALFIKNENGVQKISSEYSEVLSFDKDEKGVLFTAVTFKDKRSFPGIYYYNFETKATVTVIEEGRYRIMCAHIMGDDFCFLGADSNNTLMTDNFDFYVVKNGNEIKVSKEDMSFTNTVLYDFKYGQNCEYKVFKDEFYFVSTHGTNSHIKKIDKNGNVTTLTKENGGIEGFAIFDENTIFFNAVRGIGLSEIYKLENNEETKLTNINDKNLCEEHVSKPELMFFENNGYRVQYVVVKPLNFEENKKYPAILYIHGGAKTLYTDVFFHEIQVLASKGYFVVYGNPRGSDGQGSEFAKLMGNYGKRDYEDMMKAIDTACERYPQIDTENLGVAGGSYGGIMTNWIIGHTNKFKCACAQRSISNMITAFGTADNGYNFVCEQMDSSPWNNIEKLWEQSPLKYANNAKTPTLFIHAKEDYRCHYVEAMQMFTALKFHNVDARICLLKGENHDLSRTGRPIQRIKRIYEITMWFDKYLKQKN